MRLPRRPVPFIPLCCSLLIGACGQNTPAAPPQTASPPESNPSTSEAKPLLQNESFTAWQDGLPEGWKVEVGAGQGAVASALSSLPDGGVAFQGDATTEVWRYLAQPFPAEEGGWYRLRFSARASGIMQEEGQHNNCWVGFAFFDKAGNRLAFEVTSVKEESFHEAEFFAQAPPGTAQAEVRAFLSMTGRLEIKRLQLDALGPKDSFAILVGDMDRRYSYFIHKGIDWSALTERYRARAESAKDAESFAAVIGEMLAELKDAHVWISLPGQALRNTFSKQITPNFELEATLGLLREVQSFGKTGLTGRTAQGYGYINVASLQEDETTFSRLAEALEGMLDAPGLIIDLRVNQGGSEERAQRLASMLADAERVYALSKFRAGPRHDDFTAPVERRIAPREGKTFVGPIAVLIGPGCISSGEGFAMMLQALPHARLLGQPTRGASGNPAPVALPNGVTVFYSRWVGMLPDGTPIEDRGVLPDVPVEHQPGDDLTLKAAIESLDQRRAASGGMP